METQTAANGNSAAATEPVVKDLYTKAAFPGRLLMLGCGSIGKAILPMLLRHTDITPGNMRIVTSDDSGKNTAADAGIEFVQETLTPENYAAILKKNLKEGDFLLNLSVDVSSADLIAWCQKHNVLYVDTSTERWPGFSTDASLSIVERTNYVEREQFVELKKNKVIKNFVLSNLSFESETNRVRFTIKTTFEPQKVSASGSFLNQNK
jgi:homospermidine synthase